MAASYLVFSFDPTTRWKNKGGWEDFQGSFATLEKAQKHVKKLHEWDGAENKIQIVEFDNGKGKVVYTWEGEV